MNELQSLSMIFQNKLFRIPDYQRGYAWQEFQLIDFWEDLVNLQPDRNHYTGLLSIKQLSREDSKKLGENDQWLLNAGYKASTQVKAPLFLNMHIYATEGQPLFIIRDNYSVIDCIF